MTHERYLIVNADDFGQSTGINRGIIEAHERGVVTSASLMVRWPAAREAAKYGRSHRSLSVGLHFDFGEWRCRDGCWSMLYAVVPETDLNAVKQEARRQLAQFHNLMGTEPTHLDSHQHFHRCRALKPIFLDIASKLSIPLRSCVRRIHYHGGFYGQDATGGRRPECIRVGALIRTLERLPAGFTELGCHPGYAADLDSMYRAERAREIEALCHPRTRRALAENGITLRSFSDFAASNRGGR